MKVPYNYLPDEFNNVENIFKNWSKLIKSSEFTLGPYIEKWEAKFSKFVNSKYCISTNNGTDALILSLKALNIGPGDEVITVTNTFYATVGAIVAVGATAVLIDCDERFQIDTEMIERAITSRTKAIIPVHWGGAAPDILKILQIAKKNSLFIVEDACMGIGGYVKNKHSGTFGNIGAFSMHPLKSLNAMGDGGMVVTNNKNTYEWMKKYRNHGMVNRDHIDFWGVNIRLQPLQAVVAQNGLKKLKSSIKTRNKFAKLYDNSLKELHQFVKVPKRISDNLETFALYMCMFKDRNKLKDFLLRCGIETKIHYPRPLHLQKAAKQNCLFDKTYLKKSEYQAKHLLTLPVHQYLTEKKIDYTLSKIYKFYGKKFS